jgi:methionyl aminopeptidase
MVILKNSEEIRELADACRIARLVLDEVSALIEPGMTTADIDAASLRVMEAQGARSAFFGYRGYPARVCISVNEEIVHGIPGSRRVQYGDVVSLDVGVVYRGWVGDNAATVPVGQVSPQVADLLEATERALSAGIEAARPGRRVGDISHAVEQAATERGYSVVREFVGHGVGRRLHEEPQVPNYGPPGRGPRLKPGMTLAIEPMVNLGGPAVRVLDDGWTVVTADGQPSAHFEHTIAVTEGDPEILTCRARTPSESKAR